MRFRGVRDVVLGVLVLLGAAALGLAAVLIGQGRLGGVVPMKGVAILFVGCVLAGFFGLNLTWRGAERLIGGARTKGDLSDADD